MTTKLKMQLDTLDGLDASLHGHYEERDGKYHLSLDGYEEPDALRRAKNHEKTQRQAAEQQLRDLRTEFDTFREETQAERDDKNRKTGNIAELDASWQAKVDKIKADHTTEVETLKKQVRQIKVDQVADTLATELSESPELLRGIIHSRLTVEDGANGPETRVLDAGGALSALTVDELRDEFIANKKYAAVIRGSLASGGGSGGGGNGGSATKPFKELSEKERTDLAKSNPGEYQRQLEAYRAESKTNY